LFLIVVDRVLKLATFFSAQQIKSYLASAVEKEISCGLHLSGERVERICAFQRTFRPASLDPASPVATMYFDVHRGNEGVESPQQVREMENKTIFEFIMQHQRPKHKYVINFKTGIDLSDDEHRQYLTVFLDDACNVLLDALDRAEAKLAIAPDPLNDEIKLHLAFAKFRADRFSPTESSRAALERAKEWMDEAGGKAYDLFGPSGAGKTYVMARLMADLSTEDLRAENATTYVMRFLGTSGDSADVISLLRSICNQLRMISMGRNANPDAGVGLAACPVDDEVLVKYFNDAIRKWAWGPLVLALESLDQLKDTNLGRKLDWLPVDEVSENVKIVCSTLPDELNPEVGRPFRCLSILRKRIPDSHRFTEVCALKDSRSLIEHLLKLKHRKVNESQLALLVNTMTLAEDKAQTPLMATLIADKAAHWKSTAPIPANLPRSVRGIILQFFSDLVSYFEGLERTNQTGSRPMKGPHLTAGTRLVKHALSYITLANEGVSNTELQEILSLDDDALADSHQWWFTPDRKLPSGPLLLLLRMLAPYISRRDQMIGGALSVWYHRQLWEAAEAHFLQEDEFRASCHGVLAEFFSGRFYARPKPCNDNLRIRLDLSNEAARAGVDRHVRDQPLVLKGKSVFHSGALINERRCTEAMYHMVKELEILANLSETPQCVLERAKRAEEELCSAEGVCARGMSGETFNLVWQSAAYVRLVSGVGIDLVKINHFNRWIRRDAHEFDSALGVTLSAMRQPLTSKVREQLLASRQQVSHLPWLVLGSAVDFDAVVCVLKGHEKAVWCTHWHENRFVSGDNSGLIIVWDAFTGEKTMELRGHLGAVTSVKWSPTGSQILSGSRDKTCIIWDAVMGDKVSELQGHISAVTSVAWSPRGDRIVSGSGTPHTNDPGEVIVWNAVNAVKLYGLKGHTRAVMSVAWSPLEDKIVSGAGDPYSNDLGEIIVWNAATMEKISEPTGHRGAVMSTAWSPNGDRIVSGSYDKTCIIWDAATGNQISLLEGHTDWVHCVDWSGPGSDQIVSCSEDETLIMWDAATGEQVSKIEGYTARARSVAWSPRGDQILSGSADNTCIVWDAIKEDSLSGLHRHTDSIRCVAWSGGGDRIVSCSDDNSLIIWDSATGSQKSRLEGHSDVVMSVAWSPGGDHVISGSYDTTCRIWDAVNGENVAVLRGHVAKVTSVAWSPGGDQILSGSYDKTCIIWDARTWKKRLELNGHSEAVMSVAWNPRADRIASGSEDKTVIIWDAQKGVQVRKLKGHLDEVRSVAWGPAENLLVSGSNDKTAIVWNAVSGEKISHLPGHAGHVRGVAWSNNGTQIATCSERIIRVWHVEKGRKVSNASMLEGHTGCVTSVAWSPSDDKLVSGSNDKTAIMWTATVNEQVELLIRRNNV
jgi:WD40 repeat protein